MDANNKYTEVIRVEKALKRPKKFYKETSSKRRHFLWTGNQQLHGFKVSRRLRYSQHYTKS
jgi:hypothetical protein